MVKRLKKMHRKLMIANEEVKNKVKKPPKAKK